MSKFHSLTVTEIKKETANAVSIVFNIPNELTEDFKFTAGQYITIKKEISGKEIRRAYSICSAPTSDELRIAVKSVKNGTFSVFATSVLKEGDILEVSRPEGKFLLETSKNKSSNYLGIAAGSGITPVMAMIKAALLEEPQSSFTLIYGNKSVADTIFKTDLDALKNKFPTRFQIQYVFSRAHTEGAHFGRIDKEIINFTVKNKFKEVTFDNAFLCGPETMIDIAKKTLIENGFDKNDIQFELFTTPLSSENDTATNLEGSSEITVIVDEEATTFIMDPKTSILSSALKEGIDAPHSCQGGICSSCLAKITKGKAIMDKNSILSETEVNDGFVLTCQAHPTTQKITIDYDDV
jgi:ring-1,2-phenylacetyl-CoA epoxidase subunit PaaE